MQSDQIEQYFQELDWKFEHLNETTIISGFRIDEIVFTFLVLFRDDWLIFLVYPNLIAISDDKKNNITSLLTNLNFNTTFAKYSLDENDNIVLSIEFPICALNKEVFSLSLESLCYNAQSIYDLLPDFHVE